MKTFEGVPKAMFVPGLACLLAAVVWLAAGAWAADSPDQPERARGAMMERCRQMMAMHQKMQAETKAQNERLKQRVEAMNRAPADQRVDAMAAVINELAEQQIVRHERMQATHERMMRHMMEHMQTGRESMGRCPMMRGMMEGGPTGRGKDAEDHSEHDQP